MERTDEIGDGMDPVRMLADAIGKRPTGFEGECRRSFAA